MGVVVRVTRIIRNKVTDAGRHSAEDLACIFGKRTDHTAKKQESDAEDEEPSSVCWVWCVVVLSCESSCGTGGGVNRLPRVGPMIRVW